MPPQKKKIDKLDTVENRPLDSYFGARTSPKSVQPVNITSLGEIVPSSKNEQSRENVLNNLKDQKIIYNLTEIKSKIELLTENELTEIYKIIKNNNEKYTTNKNGIFVNLSTIRKSTIQELSSFLYFCENNDKIFDKEEEERAKYKDILTDQ